jgi:hypothetical protein
MAYFPGHLSSQVYDEVAAGSACHILSQRPRGGTITGVVAQPRDSGVPR